MNMIFLYCIVAKNIVLAGVKVRRLKLYLGEINALCLIKTLSL